MTTQWATLSSGVLGVCRIAHDREGRAGGRCPNSRADSGKSVSSYEGRGRVASPGYPNSVRTPGLNAT